MEMKETTFHWTLNYDEIDYVIEGKLEIIIGALNLLNDESWIFLSEVLYFSIKTFFCCLNSKI